ncbi:MAG: hypothetical protein IJ001_11240 [Oscillospiraceae bacterium]|nr:hypothetical protein [Oscillospiraceae bacterium]
MIDLHSHILPDLDDGSQSLRDSLAMARMAVDSGVTAMAATPHCSGDRTREVYAAWQLLREALKENGIPLKLFPGMEIFGTPDTARMLRDGQLFTLNGSRYPLIEFSFRSDGQEETWILRNVCKAGFRPIVAHPERYAYVQQDPKLVNCWHKMGCLLQVNRGSLLGRFGVHARETGMELVDRGFAAIVASDAHSPQIRTPWMEDVRRLLTEEFSPQCARVLLTENPRKILKDEEIPPVEPEWFL